MNKGKCSEIMDLLKLDLKNPHKDKHVEIRQYINPFQTKFIEVFVRLQGEMK